LNKTGSLRIT